MTPSPLSDIEVAELDLYGDLFGGVIRPLRATELWEREIMWGRVSQPAAPTPSSFTPRPSSTSLWRLLSVGS